MPERIPQSTAIRVPLQVFLTGTTTPATGKTVAVTISKNGASYANPSAGSVDATEIGSGSYYVDLSTTDTGTLGPLFVQGSCSGCDNAVQIYNVTPAVALASNLTGDPYAYLTTNLGALGAAATALASATNLAKIPVAIRQGTAQAGASTTITLDSGASATNGAYLGNLVTVGNDTRTITAYVGSTKVATVDTAWTSNPTSSSAFTIDAADQVTAAAIVTASQTGAAAAIAAAKLPTLQQISAELEFATGTSWHVSPNGSDVNDGLTPATSKADLTGLSFSNGDSVKFTPGQITLAGEVTLSKDVAFRGAGMLATTLIYSGADAILGGGENYFRCADLGLQSSFSLASQPIIFLERVSAIGQVDGVAVYDTFNQCNFTAEHCIFGSAFDSCNLIGVLYATVRRCTILSIGTGIHVTRGLIGDNGANVLAVDCDITATNANNYCGGVVNADGASSITLVNCRINTTHSGTGSEYSIDANGGVVTCYGCTFDRTKTHGNVIDLPLSALPASLAAYAQIEANQAGTTPLFTGTVNASPSPTTTTFAPNTSYTGPASGYLTIDGVQSNFVWNGTIFTLATALGSPPSSGTGFVVPAVAQNSDASLAIAKAGLSPQIAVVVPSSTGPTGVVSSGALQFYLGMTSLPLSFPGTYAGTGTPKLTVWTVGENPPNGTGNTVLSGFPVSGTWSGTTANFAAIPGSVFVAITTAGTMKYTLVDDQGGGVVVPVQEGDVTISDAGPVE